MGSNDSVDSLTGEREHGGDLGDADEGRLHVGDLRVDGRQQVAVEGACRGAMWMEDASTGVRSGPAAELPARFRPRRPAGGRTLRGPGQARRRQAPP